MDDMQAANTLKSLAAGLDPATGNAIADPALLQAPDVVRALFLGADSLEARQRLARRQAAMPRNVGKAWTQADDDRLLAGYDGGTSVDELALQLERTRAGIEARLVKHGRLQAEQVPAVRMR